MHAYGDGYYRVDASDTDAYRRYCDWEIAKGLQDVDGLKTSEYLEELQREHVDGTYSAADVVEIISDYYQRKPVDIADRTPEADQVASRIVKVIEDGGFSMSPVFLKQIHKRLFTGLIDSPYDVQFRDFNIGKPEVILAGESVAYSNCNDLAEQLDYDFSMAKRRGLFDATSQGAAGMANLISFISDIWQAHPFSEGNTRTVATFAILLLRANGFDVDNTPFAQHSWYFRNALVRANYANYPLGIASTSKPLEDFFDNALFGAKHELSNRKLYCDALYEHKGLAIPSEAFAARDRG